MMYDDKTVERFNQIQDWQGCIAIDLGRSATSSPSPPAEERAGERRPFVRGFLKSMPVGRCWAGMNDAVGVASQHL